MIGIMGPGSLTKKIFQTWTRQVASNFDSTPAALAENKVHQIQPIFFPTSLMHHLRCSQAAYSCDTRISAYISVLLCMCVCTYKYFYLLYLLSHFLVYNVGTIPI